MNEQKLNEKLAKWAGFKAQYWRDPLNNIDEVYNYKQPDGFEVLLPPNFSQSLGACFKWLVPKSTKEFSLSRIEFCYSTGGNFNGIKLHRNFKEGVVIQLMGEKQEAIALCLAIEKLIDK